MPIHILILVCALGTPVDECTRDTAIDVIQAGRGPNELMCGKLAQATLASTVLAAEEGRQYVKIECERDR